GFLPCCGVNDIGRSPGPHRVGDDGCRRVSVISEAELISQYRTHVRPLYAYVARRTGGNRQLAEDVVQETWLRALRDWRCNGLPREPLAWLSRVASNLLASYFRAQKPHTSLDVTQLLDDEVPQAPTREAAATLYVARARPIAERLAADAAALEEHVQLREELVAVRQRLRGHAVVDAIARARLHERDGEVLEHDAVALLLVVAEVVARVEELVRRLDVVAFAQAPVALDQRGAHVVRAAA